MTSCEKKYKITKNLSDKYELQILSDGMTEKEEHENGAYHKRRSLWFIEKVQQRSFSYPACTDCGDCDEMVLQSSLAGN